MRRITATTLFALIAAGLMSAGFPARAQVVNAERSVEPVVLTGAQLPDWSRLPAQGVGTPGLPSRRDAHNGNLFVPPDTRPGAPVDKIVAFSWTGSGWREVPVQVDERFPYFLANNRSSFSPYSQTDKELTYEWDVESWKKTAGQCEAAYPDEDTTLMKGFPTQDPVTTFDDDDELVFMASDAGARAPDPEEVRAPVGTGDQRYEIELSDPLANGESYIYLFQRDGGSTFTAQDGYVSYERDENADQWIDRRSFSDDDPEKLGSSNTSYGPNLVGTVCDPDGTIRQSTDRFPRDGVTVTTDSYRWRATGRWMVRQMHVAQPGQPGTYGPDLIDRWKGRAFQQSPDSRISQFGFEDEQVNWEANSSLLGELSGPVRAIREVWGADSGTNVTKTETFYRDAITYRYRVRVHPIPPDGLYTSWDYNHDQVGYYYNATKPAGVKIDGINDDVGNVDRLPAFGPAFFDAPDPTFNAPLSLYNWEQVSGNDANGSLVYMFELKNAQGLENPTVVPYYRDDACLDDGTGDDPSPRPNPGDAYSDGSFSDEERNRPCYTEAPAEYSGPYRQGAFGSHGIHYFFTGDTDNAFVPEPTTEIDGQQWQWAVPTEAPRAVGEPYANTVRTPLLATTDLQPSSPKDPTEIEITGPRSGQTTDVVTLEARLTSRGQPVAGEELSFVLESQQVGVGTTDGSGLARVDTRLSGPARSTTLEVVYAGDDTYGPSRADSGFEILKEDSALDLTVTHSRGRFTATAHLSDLDSSSGLAGKTIHFLVNGTEVRTATTDTDGNARAEFTHVEVKQGDVIRAVFDGDDSFIGSSDEATATAR